MLILDEGEQETVIFASEPSNLTCLPVTSHIRDRYV